MLMCFGWFFGYVPQRLEFLKQTTKQFRIGWAHCQDKMEV